MERRVLSFALHEFPWCINKYHKKESESIGDGSPYFRFASWRPGLPRNFSEENGPRSLAYHCEVKKFIIK